MVIQNVVKDLRLRGKGFHYMRICGVMDIPMRGCTRRPDNGPARNAIAVNDFERPNLMRYGDASSLLRKSRAVVISFTTFRHISGLLATYLATSQQTITPARLTAPPSA